MSAELHPLVLPRNRFPDLVSRLREAGYRVLGPRVESGAIVYDEIGSVEELPIGWTDDQDAGTYRLRRRSDEAIFGFVVGPHSWKKFLHPPRIRLWKATRWAPSARKESPRDGAGLEIAADREEVPKQAFLGVRACELEAIRIQDRVFLEGPYVDPIYRERREKTFIVAVQCVEAGGTCFCASMGTGPRARTGFDLALTELVGGDVHEFVVEIGSERGASLIGPIGLEAASPGQLASADEATGRAAREMGRAMDTTGIRELFGRNAGSSRWTEVAERCLACANCTMACPTCFCTSVEDVTDLTGESAERWRRWDSCFDKSFSYIHGGSVRSTVSSRYRQWITHKLATWHDQFGSSGCVGCGRCITWCPVGIDITQEVAALREEEKSHPDSAAPGVPLPAGG